MHEREREHHVVSPLKPFEPVLTAVVSFILLVLIIGLVLLALYDWPLFIILMPAIFIGAVCLGFVFAFFALGAFAVKYIHQPLRNPVMAHSEQWAITRASPSTQFHQVTQERTTYNLKGELGEPTQMALPAPGLPIAPAYQQIAHTIAPGHILLGYGRSGPIIGDITDLLSTAIVGRPGTGKSTMLRFVVAMLLQIGGIPLLWDPHGSIVDELGDVLSCAETGAEIEASASRINTELDSRLLARRQGKVITQPMLLIADEWPIISQIAPSGLQVARRVVLEGRKVSMYSLIAGQGLPAKLLDGSLVRDALSSRYVFNTTPAQARMAGLDNDIAKVMLAQLDTGGPGKAILASATRKPEIVAIPSTTAEDIRLLVSGNARFRPETAIEADADELSNVFPFPGRDTGVSTKESEVVGNEIRETIKRMHKKRIPLRDIAPLVGLAGRKYELFKQVCREEGIDSQAEMEA